MKAPIISIGGKDIVALMEEIQWMQQWGAKNRTVVIVVNSILQFRHWSLILNHSLTTKRAVINLADSKHVATDHHGNTFSVHMLEHELDFTNNMTMLLTEDVRDTPTISFTLQKLGGFTGSRCWARGKLETVVDTRPEPARIHNE